MHTHINISFGLETLLLKNRYNKKAHRMEVRKDANTRFPIELRTSGTAILGATTRYPILAIIGPQRGMYPKN
ncbi:hypothetical protein RRG08_005608 [Elysia crispata]|uniref:Uncharacterized protein n=1 Tax=Elysia crispata TaxID=231223 RepID=A0AAE0YZ96_9GAST|nr:hypothetical protein RRG08_005608 [Elysia crispata]